MPSSRDRDLFDYVSEIKQKTLILDDMTATTNFNSYQQFNFFKRRVMRGFPSPDERDDETTVRARDVMISTSCYEDPNSRTGLSFLYTAGCTVVRMYIVGCRPIRVYR